MAFLNCCSMCIFQVRISETWMPRSFAVFEWSSFRCVMLNFRSLPRNVIFVHLSMAISILFFSTHSSILIRSSCFSQFVFLIESSFKSSAEMNGSEKLRTSDRSFISMQKSNGPGATLGVLHLQHLEFWSYKCRFLHTACGFEASWWRFEIDTLLLRFGRPVGWVQIEALCQRLQKLQCRRPQFRNLSRCLELRVCFWARTIFSKKLICDTQNLVHVW